MPTCWQAAWQPCCLGAIYNFRHFPPVLQLAGVSFPSGAADVYFNTWWCLKCMNWGFHSGGRGYFPDYGITFLLPQPVTLTGRGSCGQVLTRALRDLCGCPTGFGASAKLGHLSSLCLSSSSENTNMCLDSEPAGCLQTPSLG